MWFSSRGEAMRHAGCSTPAGLLRQLVVAKVLPSGARRFKVCCTEREYLANGSEEVIGGDTEHYAYFDFDGCGELSLDPAGYVARAVESVMGLLRVPRDELGATVQVCTRNRPGKASVHVKVNVMCRQSENRGWAEALKESLPAGFGLDVGVYSSWQCFSKVYSEKPGAGRLRPLPGCSGRVSDHLVRALALSPQRPSRCERPTVAVSRSPSSASGDRVCSLEAHERMALMRGARASGLAVGIGLAARARPYGGSRMGSRISAYIAPGDVRACPFAGRRHRRNRGVLRLDTQAMLVEYTCLHPGCAGRRVGCRVEA